MIRTQIQLPDQLFEQAKRVAGQREISMAELVRRGLEYMVSISRLSSHPDKWTLPQGRHLGGNDPFATDDWRTDLHVRNVRVAESGAPYQPHTGKHKPG